MKNVFLYLSPSFHIFINAQFRATEYNARVPECFSVKLILVELSMVIFGLLVPLFCLAVPVAVVVVAMMFCLVAQFCIAAPPTRTSEQGDYAASTHRTEKERVNQDDEGENQQGNWTSTVTNKFTLRKTEIPLKNCLKSQW